MDNQQETKKLKTKTKKPKFRIKKILNTKKEFSSLKLPPFFKNKG